MSCRRGEAMGVIYVVLCLYAYTIVCICLFCLDEFIGIGRRYARVVCKLVN